MAGAGECTAQPRPTTSTPAPAPLLPISTGENLDAALGRTPQSQSLQPKQWEARATAVPAHSRGFSRGFPQWIRVESTGTCILSRVGAPAVALVLGPSRLGARAGGAQAPWLGTSTTGSTRRILGASKGPLTTLCWICLGLPPATKQPSHPTWAANRIPRCRHTANTGSSANTANTASRANRAKRAPPAGQGRKSLRHSMSGVGTTGAEGVQTVGSSCGMP